MFIAAAKRTPVNLEEWAVQMMEKHNRKSHLAPQLSPSTQALLRGESQPSPSKDSTPSAPSTATKTPTSGIIPIVEDDARRNATSDFTTAQRTPSNDINGAGIYHSQSSTFDRQAFPPRTSSNLTASTTGRLRDGESFSPTGGLPSHPRDSGNINSTTTLPIRPAPPPSGPLPAPPSSGSRSSTIKRPTQNGTAYNYGDTHQY